MKPPYFGAALVAFCFPIHSILLTLSRSPGVCIDRLCALRHNQYGPFANFGEVTLVVHGFEAGQLVVCRYRLPGELQPWIHEVHIGEVVEPGDDPAKWNGHNSERYYCE